MVMILTDSNLLSHNAALVIYLLTLGSLHNTLTRHWVVDRTADTASGIGSQKDNFPPCFDVSPHALPSCTKELVSDRKSEKCLELLVLESNSTNSSRTYDLTAFVPF